MQGSSLIILRLSKTTVQKKWEKTRMSNNRPISLLTTFSKESEKMHSRLPLFANNILVPEQFGFRRGLSIENSDFKLAVY
jgi:hypothetical protein